MKNFKVFQQHLPLRVTEDSGKKRPTHSQLRFEQDCYLANVRLAGTLQAENAHTAIIKAKLLYKKIASPLVEEVTQWQL